MKWVATVWHRSHSLVHLPLSLSPFAQSLHWQNCLMENDLHQLPGEILSITLKLEAWDGQSLVFLVSLVSCSINEGGGPAVLGKTNQSQRVNWIHFTWECDADPVGTQFSCMHNDVWNLLGHLCLEMLDGTHRTTGGTQIGPLNVMMMEDLH